jgi:hypothetical protein
LLGETNSQSPGMILPQENPEPRAPSNYIRLQQRGRGR